MLFFSLGNISLKNLDDLLIAGVLIVLLIEFIFQVGNFSLFGCNLFIEDIFHFQLVSMILGFVLKIVLAVLKLFFKDFNFFFGFLDGLSGFNSFQLQLLNLFVQSLFGGFEGGDGGSGCC